MIDFYVEEKNRSDTLPSILEGKIDRSDIYVWFKTETVSAKHIFQGRDPLGDQIGSTGGGCVQLRDTLASLDLVL